MSEGDHANKLAYVTTLPPSVNQDCLVCLPKFSNSNAPGAKPATDCGFESCEEEKKQRNNDITYPNFDIFFPSHVRPDHLPDPAAPPDAPAAAGAGKAGIEKKRTSFWLEYYPYQD